MTSPHKQTIPAELAPEIFKLASQYSSEQLENYSTSELMAAASEAGIPAEYIPQAITELQSRQSELRQKKQHCRRRVKQLLVVTAIAATGIIGWSIITYNAMANRELQVEAAWAQVENQLQRRADLIPQLVKVTQAYATHESTLVTSLNEARQAYVEARGHKQQQDAIAKIDQAIDQFQTYALRHSELKSNQLYINLQYEITGTENRLAVERMRYNQSVQSFRQQIQGFPNVIVADTVGFESKPFLNAD